MSDSLLCAFDSIFNNTSKLISKAEQDPVLLHMIDDYSIEQTKDIRDLFADKLSEARNRGKLNLYYIKVREIENGEKSLKRYEAYRIEGQDHFTFAPAQGFGDGLPLEYRALLLTCDYLREALLDTKLLYSNLINHL